jgi:uncharacterized membrane protein YhdT
MSFYIGLAAIIIEAVALVATSIAVVIVLAKSRQSTDASDKASLRAAGIMLGLSILFVVIFLISAFAGLATRGCTKRKRWILLISGILSGLSLMISLIIIYVIASKYQKAGKTGDAQNLRGSAGTVIVSLVLHVVAFILLWLVIGRRLAQIGKQCRRIAPKIEAAKAQVATVTQTAATA